jgi:phenylacetate-CoA ligase
MHKNIVKHVLFPLHERFFGRKTYQYIQELENLQWASPQELEELRFRKLRALLVHAKKNVPFYRERFDSIGFDPTKLKGIGDFKILPVLTKVEIRQNLEKMKWMQCPGGLFRYNTGGSSGEPLIFYFDRRRQAYDAAARALVHRWWDIDIGDKELYLWGSPLEITKQDRIKDIRDRLTNQLLVSAFELSSDKIPGIVTRLRKFRPYCIFGYPSTIALFCQMAANQNFRIDDVGIKVVFSTAEVLYNDQLDTIRKYLGGVPVADGYGSREGGFISHQCKEGTYHVIDPNYVIEYLKDGREVKPGEDGEIVITHLDAWGMPFIRYSTGDVAQQGEGLCKCGRSFSTMAKIRGRTTDFIVTPDGRWQHALSVIYVVRDIEGVDEFRIIQEDVDDVHVLLKVHEDIYPSDGNNRIVKGIKKRMGEEVAVAVEMVDEIPRDASGKYRYVVSKVAQRGFH